MEIKFGSVWIRSAILCASFKFTWGGEIKDKDMGLETERVVKELSRDLVNGNPHLYFDNFSSSYKLMKDLLEDNI